MSIINKRKVAIIGTNGLPANYGGFETLVSNIHQTIAETHEVTIYCSKKSPRVSRYIGRTRLIRIPLSANGWQSFLYDFISITHSLFYADTLIILGLSGGLALPLLHLFPRKVLYNPGGVETSKVRGLKLTGKLESYIKTIFDQGFFRFSDKIILDNEAFFDSLALYTDKLRLIEYGGEEISTENIIKWDCPFDSYDISVSRAQEDMNLHLVLEAYSKCARNLVMISNWTTSDYGQDLWSKYYGKFVNIFLHDAVYDKAKLNAMRMGASLYVHSHMLCGTAPSLVEAMSLHLGIICFDVPTNRYTTEEKAIYFNSTEDLVLKLSGIEDTRIELIKESMKEIADRRYSWKLIAEKYLELI